MKMKMMPRGQTTFSLPLPPSPISTSVLHFSHGSGATEILAPPRRIMHSMRPPPLSLSLSLSLSPSSPLPLPLSSSSSSSSSSSLLLRPKRLRPLSSLRETKKVTHRKASNVPQNLRFDNRKGRGEGSVPDDAEAGGQLGGGGVAVGGTVLAGLLLVGVVGGFGAVGYVYRDQINAFLTQFSGFIEGYGPAGYALFVLVYAGLEILAIPAIPLTMSAGLLFGSVTGTIIVSISGTVAAAVAFLIASWLGMLPGTWAYVSAGAFGRAIIQEESDVGLPGGNGQLLTLGLGLLFTAVAATYVTRLAKDAVKDIE